MEDNKTSYTGKDYPVHTNYSHKHKYFQKVQLKNKCFTNNKGGVYGKIQKGKLRKSRAINNISKFIRVNQILWEELEKFAATKQV